MILPCFKQKFQDVCLQANTIQMSTEPQFTADLNTVSLI